MTILLMHGWGFDATLWDDLCGHLRATDVVRWDRGYFGAPARPEATPTLAVGHSLGALLLAAWLPSHVPLVAINGFDRFTGADAVPPRPLRRMRVRLRTTPQPVVDAFRARCGAPPAPPVVDTETLADDLCRLERRTAPANGRRVLLLNGADDPILPPAMRETTFAGAERAVAPGGHLLPLTHPEWCAARIAAWA